MVVKGPRLDEIGRLEALGERGVDTPKVLERGALLTSAVELGEAQGGSQLFRGASPSFEAFAHHRQSASASSASMRARTKSKSRSARLICAWRTAAAETTRSRLVP